MNTLTQTLAEIYECNYCWLMAKNNDLKIKYIPINPKPNARFVFIGRDPSPSSVNCVGLREGKSVFIKEVFAIAEEAGVSEKEVYITDVVKCHWRTSRGTPIKGTENRSTLLPTEIAKVCAHQWLFKEIEILIPKVIISFGEELYQLLRENIIEPNPVPKKLSASLDKSIIDAELLFGEGVSFKIQLGSIVSYYAPLRHAGNSISLPQHDSQDKRSHAHNLSKERLIRLLMQGAYLQN